MWLFIATSALAVLTLFAASTLDSALQWLAGDGWIMVSFWTLATTAIVMNALVWLPHIIRRPPSQ